MSHTRLRVDVIDDLTDAIVALTPVSALRIDEDEDYREHAACWECRDWPESREMRKMYRHIWRVTYHRLQVAICEAVRKPSAFEAAVALDAARKKILNNFRALPVRPEED